jgi:hypothetical protein
VLRAPTGFSARMKSIRAENPVTDNGADGLVFLYEIVDCARMAFSSVHNRRSARTAFSSAQHRGSQISNIWVLGAALRAANFAQILDAELLQKHVLRQSPPAQGAPQRA